MQEGHNTFADPKRDDAGESVQWTLREIAIKVTGGTRGAVGCNDTVWTTLHAGRRDTRVAKLRTRTPLSLPANLLPPPAQRPVPPQRGPVGRSAAEVSTPRGRGEWVVIGSQDSQRGQ